MNVAVIGGGINGVMSAWALALRGYSVDLFERDRLMGATSSASTKLLHGGLRYLEQGHIRLVTEALHERRWWMMRAPHLVKRLRLILPVYEKKGRPQWILRAGLSVYEWLAGNDSLGKWKWRTRKEMECVRDELLVEGLDGAFEFYEAQMDDLALGLWAAENAAIAGVRIQTETPVGAISPDAGVQIHGKWNYFDRVVNATGPWARKLLDDSGISARRDLDLIRGSHLLINHSCENGYLLQSPRDGRMCFALPHEGRTLLGTTEVRQEISEPINCSPSETSYLLEIYRHYFPSRSSKIAGKFSGLRPLIHSHANPNKATREYAIEKNRGVISVFGGKWTTSRILGLRVAEATARPH